MSCILKLTQNSQLEQLFASFSRLPKCCNPASLLQTQANQFRYLSLNKVALRDVVDSQNERSSIEKKFRWRRKSYSIADDNLIAKQIEAYGRNIATGKKIAKQLGLKEKSYQSILDRHKFYIVNKPTVKGDFSPHEDEIILDYVKKNGCSFNTIKDLTLLLSRGSPESVKRRLLALSSEAVIEPKQWTFEDDAIMVKYIVKNFWDKDSNYPPEQIKLSDFENLALKLRRSRMSVYNHYFKFVLPILKTHTRGLPMEENWMWQKNLMLHIIDRKIEKSNDINYDDLLTKNSFVGQTYQSLALFVENSNKIIQNNVRVLANDIMWKRYERKYHRQSPFFLCFNERRQAKKLKRIQNIIEAFEK